MSLREYTRFLGEFVSKPGVVGAVSPSSHSLGRKMVEWIDWPNVRTVVEYGPGTGAITEHILAEMRPGTTFLAIEINPSFVESLRIRYPDVRVHQESVTNVRAICREEGIDEVDAVVSGLPWASFSDDDQSAYLNAMMTVLRPGGRFATFAYLQGLLLPAGRRFRRNLRQYFSQIELSRTAWRNLPPAFVYRCCR